MHVPITFLWRVYKNSRFSPSHLDSLWVPICVFAAKSLQLCPTLCNPIDGSPPGSAIPGILQARIVVWVAIFFSNEVTQSCLTLSDPMDGRLPGSSIHGIFQARVLESVAIAFSGSLCINMLIPICPSTKANYLNKPRVKESLIGVHLADNKVTAKHR